MKFLSCRDCCFVSSGWGAKPLEVFVDMEQLQKTDDMVTSNMKVWRMMMF